LISFFHPVIILLVSPQKNSYVVLILMSILLCAMHSVAIGQVTGAVKVPRFIPKKPGDFDTLGVKNAADLAKETIGMMETSIPAEEYIVGPGDILTILLGALMPGATELPQTDAIVSPDGRIMIPGIGAVKVAGLSLAAAEKQIIRAAEGIMKNRSIAVSLRKMRSFKVILSGAVRKPGIVISTPADRLSEVLDRAGGVLTNASIRRIRIQHADSTEKTIIADLQKFYSFGAKNANPLMRGGDIIYVPPLSESDYFQVEGHVGAPGKYEFAPGDKLSDALRTALGFLAGARIDSVEFARFGPDGKLSNVRIIDLSGWENISDNLTATLPGDFALMAGDRVYVREIPKWKKSMEVAIVGEVNKPGRYSVNRDSSNVLDIINRAGGFTNDAYIQGAILIRQTEVYNEYDNEYWRLSQLPVADLTEKEKAFMREKKRESRGLISLDFTKLAQTNAMQIRLEDRDSIVVPPLRNFVNIFGKVRIPGRVPYNNNFSYRDYIQMAGGFSSRADEGETLILKPRGEQFLANKDEYILQPGDQILVPEIPESKTTFLQALTTVLAITSQLVTVAGFIFTLSRLRN
jgi:protein involved in polysaccharide export with SLBB domain